MSDQTKETKQKLQREAKENLSRLRQLRGIERTSSMEIGFIGRQMKAGNQFSILGFKTEGDFVKGIKIGRSTWFRYVRIAEGFKELSKSKFLRLQAEKAELAVRWLEEEERYEEKWLKLIDFDGPTEEEFEKRLIKNKAEKTGTSEGEQRVTLKLRMYVTQRDVITGAMKKFAKAHGLKEDDEGGILELICAEATNGGNILAAVQKSLPELRAMAMLIKDSDLSSDELLTKLRDAVERHVLALGKSVGMNLREVDPKVLKFAEGKALTAAGSAN